MVNINLHWGKNFGHLAGVTDVTFFSNVVKALSASY